jgi:glycerol-3-phosphate acyltransferase PlsY
VLWTALGFVLGAVPFSVLLGRLALGTDIRRYGDGNPGAANAWRAGSWRVGVPATLLDYLKGAVPVGLAYLHYGVAGWAMVAVGLAPVLGHAFSPFLRGRGGKAVAASFGIWTGLTVWQGPTALGTLFGIFWVLQVTDAWAVMLSMLAWLGCLVLGGADRVLLAIWGGDMLVLLWKHRCELQCRPRLNRPRLPFRRSQ